MSILIKDMEMPETCGLCKLCLDDSRICNGYCMFFHRRVNMMERDKSCPLVPVPPHGDLIERETVHELVNWTRFKPPFSRKQVRRFIDNAPTIIEAEIDDG